MRYAQLHCHTTFSNSKFFECRTTPEKLLKMAKKKGLSAVAITDHNTLKGNIEAQKLAYKYNIIVIPAMEIDTSERSHILAYGIKKAIKPYRKQDVIIKEIHDQGGIAILAHPYNSVYKTKNLKETAKLADGVEVMNMGTFGNRKAQKFAKKNNIKVQTVGADAHVSSLLDSAVVAFYDECKQVEDYLAALKTGFFHRKLKRSHLYATIVATWNIIYTQVYGFLTAEFVRDKLSLLETDN